MRNLVFLFCLLFWACKEEYGIKPIGQLRLEYPEPRYIMSDLDCSFSFEYAEFSTINLHEKQCWFSLHYPEMKANIYLTYFPVKDREDLAVRIKDSEKFVQEQTVKATYIAPQEFIFPERKVYGTLFELGGDAAINLQFHATDSVKHLLSGSVYFSTPPKYDSLQPAIQYLKRDVIHLIETLEWK